MLLITDATSIAGRAIARQLTSAEREFCCLLRPSRREQRLPRGIRCRTVCASASDLPALRSALLGVTTVAHSAEESELASGTAGTDHLQATSALISAMQEIGVRRLVYLSRLGAMRTSAYPMARLRGEAEALVAASGLDYTILQSSLSYGEEDTLTNVLVMLAKVIPFFLPIPDTGMARFQPIWIDDLARCAIATVTDTRLIGQTIPVGGPEHFTYPQMVAAILAAAHVRRRVVHARMGLLRGISQPMDVLFVRNPLPMWWLDMLDAGLATELRMVREHFGFEPSRFADCLSYLSRKRSWRRDLIRYLFDRR